MSPPKSLYDKSLQSITQQEHSRYTTTNLHSKCNYSRSECVKIQKYLHIEKRCCFLFRQGTIQLIVSKKPDHGNKNRCFQYIEYHLGGNHYNKKHMIHYRKESELMLKRVRGISPVILLKLKSLERKFSWFKTSYNIQYKQSRI